MKKILLLIIFLPFITSAQIITTVAGNGIFGYIGDGLQATVAEIMQPSCVAVDNSGNFYFGDNALIIIRKVDASGTITKVAGLGIGGYNGDGGPATQAQLNGVSSIVFDHSGNMYLADAGNNVIRKINASGTITTVAGSGYGAGTVYGGFSGDGGAATAAKMFDPTSIAIDRYHNIYITDTRNYRVRKVDTNGIITTVAGNGISIYSGDGGAATAASLIFPTNVTTDTAGNIYFQDYNHIRKVTPEGHISTVVGYGLAGFSGDGGPAFTAQLDAPSGIVIDSAGDMYIADTHNNRIRKVDAATGIINTIAGTGIPGYSGDGSAALAAELRAPSGLAYWKGNLYIADAQNNRIRKMKSVGGTLNTPIVAAQSISIYPNPATTELNVAADDKITDVAIFNQLGETISVPYVATDERHMRLNICNIPVGIYFVRINGGYTQSFIKD